MARFQELNSSSYLCNLVVPGFPKSGTSSFHEYLSQHPDICMSEQKEPHYFAKEDKWAGGRESHNKIFTDRTGSFKYYGESSTIYCIHEPAITRIKQCLKNPKIIFIIRHPVERMISHYKWLYSLGLESRSILVALEQSGAVFDPDKSLRGNYMGYLLFSSYSKYLPLWFEAFGDNNVHLVSSSSLRDEPEKSLNAVFEFLGIENLSGLSSVNVNATDDVRIKRSVNVMRTFSKLIPATIRSGLKSHTFAREILENILYKKVLPPVITKAEIIEIQKILDQEVKYFDCLFHNAK